MNWQPKAPVLALAIVFAGFLAAGCAQGGGNLSGAVASLSPGQNQDSPSFSPPTFSPKTRSPRPTRPAQTAQATSAAAVPPASSPSPEASAAPAQTPAASGTGTSYLWLWILLGVVAIVAVAALIARRSGRRSATKAGWQARVAEARAKGSALYDAMSMAEAPGAWPAGDPGSRWADIQRRADDLAQDLYELRETAPGEMERARIEDVLAALQAVRSAMNAEHGPGGTAVPQLGRVHALLMSFEASLSALRSPGDYYGP